ncbi:MAG: hypothetical protein ACOXZ0_07060 [Eubacteriales bacterium]
MIDIDKINGAIAEKRLTREKVAKHLGMHRNTFANHLKNGTLGLKDAKKLIVLLDIKNPNEIFFA